MGIDKIPNNYKWSLSNEIKRIKSSSFDAEYLVYHYVKTKNKITKFFLKRELEKKYNIFLNSEISIGDNLHLPHPTGIVIGKGASIGDNVTIYQQVTIGGKNIGDTRNGRIAKIDNNVVIFSGAKILGNVFVGTNTIIGANAVVTKDIESNGVYAGVPACKIK